MTTKLTRTMLSARHAISDDAARYMLTRLKVEPEGDGAIAVATNGHTLIAVYDKAGSGEAAITSDSVAALAKMAGPPKKSNAVTLKDGVGTVNEQSVILQHCEPDFYQWRSLMPSEPPIARIMLDASYVLELAKAAVEFHAAAQSGEYNCWLTIDVRDTGKPGEFRASGPNGELFVALCMPSRDKPGAWGRAFQAVAETVKATRKAISKTIRG